MVVINVSISVVIMNVYAPVALVENSVNFLQTTAKIITARMGQHASMGQEITRVTVRMVIGVIYVK